MSPRPLHTSACASLALVAGLLAIPAFSAASSEPAATPAATTAAATLPTLKFPQFVPGEPIRLVAYGDSRFAPPSTTSGVNARVRDWLVHRIADEHPMALLLTGDTPFHGALVSDWQAFQTQTSSWRAQHIVQLPATGNHEIYGGAPQGIANYLKNFPDIAGHRHYSALLGNVEVISLDCTEAAGATSPQARWLASQLDHVPPQIDFLLILYHIPFVADRQSQLLVNLPSPDAVALRRILEARLPKLRARVIVLNGHIHNYERFERKGVQYVITGGGGAEPYPVLYRGPNDLYRDTGFPVYHYLTLYVKGTHLHAVMWKVKDPGASTLEVEAKDEFTLDARPHPAKARGKAR